MAGDLTKMNPFRFMRAKDSIIIDTSYFGVIYRTEYTNKDNNKRGEIATDKLLIGDSYSIYDNISGNVKDSTFYSATFKYQGDIDNYLKFLQTHPIKDNGVEVTGGSPDLYRKIVYDKKNATMKTILPGFWEGTPDKPFNSVIYTQKNIEIKWIYLDGEKKISGYNCKKAKCSFNGKEWELWYTEEIPFSDGPWKLKGAPGLILSAEDADGFYSFYALKVFTTPEVMYDINYINQKKISYKKYRRYEKSNYKHPYSFVTPGTVALIPNERTKKFEQADYYNWEIDYFPMEK